MSNDPYYMDEVGATMMYDNYENADPVGYADTEEYDRRYDNEGGFTSPESVEAHRLRADLTEPPLSYPTEEIRATKGELIDLLDQYEAVLNERDGYKITLGRIARGDYDNVEIARKALGWL